MIDDLIILIQSIEKGFLLGSESLSKLNILETLNRRDRPDFDEHWVRCFSFLRDRAMEPSGVQLLDSLRELAYKAAFRATASPDLAGYVADDFELIGKAILLNFEDDFPNSMLYEYSIGNIPGGVGPCRSIRTSIEQLRLKF